MSKKRKEPLQPPRPAKASRKPMPSPTIDAAVAGLEKAKSCLAAALEAIKKTTARTLSKEKLKQYSTLIDAVRRELNELSKLSKANADTERPAESAALGGQWEDSEFDEVLGAGAQVIKHSKDSRLKSSPVFDAVENKVNSEVLDILESDSQRKKKLPKARATKTQNAAHRRAEIRACAVRVLGDTVWPDDYFNRFREKVEGHFKVGKGYKPNFGQDIVRGQVNDVWSERAKYVKRRSIADLSSLDTS